MRREPSWRCQDNNEKKGGSEDIEEKYDIVKVKDGNEIEQNGQEKVRC